MKKIKEQGRPTVPGGIRPTAPAGKVPSGQSDPSILKLLDPKQAERVYQTSLLTKLQKNEPFNPREKQDFKQKFGFDVDTAEKFADLPGPAPQKPAQIKVDPAFTKGMQRARGTRQTFGDKSFLAQLPKGMDPEEFSDVPGQSPLGSKTRTLTTSKIPKLKEILDGVLNGNKRRT